MTMTVPNAVPGLWRFAFGNLLGQRRRALGLRQVDVATKISLSEARIRQLECGFLVKPPPPDVLDALAMALSIDRADLIAVIFGDEPEAAA